MYCTNAPRWLTATLVVWAPVICHELVIDSLTEIYLKSPIWAEGVHSAPHGRKQNISPFMITTGITPYD